MLSTATNKVIVLGSLHDMPARPGKCRRTDTLVCCSPLLRTDGGLNWLSGHGRLRSGRGPWCVNNFVSHNDGGISRKPSMTRSSASSSSVNLNLIRTMGACQGLLPCPTPLRFSTSSSPHLRPRVAASRGPRRSSRIPDALSLMRVNHVVLMN